MQQNILVVFDFDHTILDDNTDTSLFNLIPNKEESTKLWNKYSEGKWTEFMNTVLQFLHENHTTIDDIKQELVRLPLVEGMKELLVFIANQPHIDSIITSDANSVFIETILKHHGLTKTFKEIFTNPAQGDDSGRLHVKPCHEHSHSSCPKNMCKSKLVSDFKEKMGRDFYSHVCYVGDGSNDLCPCLQLSKSDIAFPRKGYTLEKKISNLKRDAIKAKVVPWSSAIQILTEISNLVNPV